MDGRPFLFARVFRWQRARELQRPMEQTTTPSAAPSQSTDSSATTVGNASAALALADATSTATPQTTTETAPAAAIEQPATTEGSPSTETKGEPPKWRWQDILENARSTEYARGRKEIEDQFAWAKDIPQHERDGLITWRRAMNGDPDAIAHIKRNQQAVQWLKGLVAEQQQPAADPEPEPDFVLPVKDANGNVVGERPIYSAETQAKREAWLKRQWMAEVRKELQPLQQTAQTFQQREAQATYQATTASVIAQMESADPDFKAHKSDVGAEIQKDQDLLNLAMTNVKLAMELAWGRVRTAKVLPLKQQQAEAKVLTDLQQRAVAATTNPATASTATPKPTLGNARAALEQAYAQLGS